MRLEPPTSAPLTPGASKQPEEITHKVQHSTHAATAPLTDAQTHSSDAANHKSDASLRHGRAVQAHAGHAGLLRFKRQWPMPRPVMLSGSDDSDSLSDFDSIADFHLESAADQKLAHQDSCRPANRPGSAAARLKSSGAGSNVAHSSKATGTGQVMYSSQCQWS